jgi:alpha-tubulin suppressor-like RCC1 family protein
MNSRFGQRRSFRLTTTLALLLLLAWGAAPAAAAPAQPDPDPALDFTQIAAGASFSCGLTSAGGVKCWGDNTYGQLGDGTTDAHSTPVDVVDLAETVTAISAGGAFTCALLASGGVACWGYNGQGQLGDGTTGSHYTPAPVPGLSGVTAIDAGSGHVCAALETGGMQCWGWNIHGQLGDGSTDQRNSPVPVSDLTGIVTNIGAGDYHTCAVSGGGLLCWGLNGSGQLGNGTTDVHNTPVAAIALSNVLAVTAAQYHTCALESGGGMKCWGYNAVGQLGDGTTEGHSTPAYVKGLTGGVSAIAANGNFTCAARTAGGVRCWGDNWDGQLGDGTRTSHSLPAPVSGLASSVTALAAGRSHTCAVLPGGAAQCWGLNGFGQLGDGTLVQRSIPADVSGLTGGVTTIAGGGDYTCILTSGGAVKCWGSDSYGQLGDGTTLNQSAPVDVAGLSGGVTAIVAGESHTCALLGGGVKCWGNNSYGQLGDGTTMRRPAPIDVPGLTDAVTAIAAGRYHTCAALAAGGVMCWGYNSYGQLGDGSTAQKSSPMPVLDLTDIVTAVDAGDSHTCALLEGGGVKCWGANYSGQLGDGTTASRGLPAYVSGLTSDVLAIAAGSGHTCALVPDALAVHAPAMSGGMKCWGANDYGQLGDASQTRRLEPVLVSGMASGVTGIAAGWWHTCALAGDGAARCWGENRYGALGDGTIANRNAPADVTGVASGGSGIAAGGYHTCVLVGAGRPKCWGKDRYGQLGTGRELQETTPADVAPFAPALLQINYPGGRPGSTFTITGWNFPPGAMGMLSINGEDVATDLAVNPTGSFIVFQETIGADAGGYTATVSVNPSASARFWLSGAAPLRSKEGGGQVLGWPGGIEAEQVVYAPVVCK